MEIADLEGCWTNRGRGKEIFQYETLWLFGPRNSEHALGDPCSMADHQGGDCGGSTRAFSGPWSLEGDLLTMKMATKTESGSGRAGHRNYEASEPFALTVTARVVREKGERAIRLEWNGGEVTLYRRAT